MRIISTIKVPPNTSITPGFGRAAAINTEPLTQTQVAFSRPS